MRPGTWSVTHSNRSARLISTASPVDRGPRAADATFPSTYRGTVSPMASSDSELLSAAVLVQPDGLVPKARYVDADFCALELERVWYRVWQVACREEEIPDVGDFVEYTIGDQSVLVLRSGAETVQAHANACLHRGTRLATERGSFGEGPIKCRYHGWCYAIDGRLTDVVDRDEFPTLSDDLALGRVRCERWGGFVFVNLDPDAEPLLDFLAPLPEMLSAYKLESMRLRSSQTTFLPANWKVVIDAFNEGYHVQGTHPQILPWTDDVNIAYEQLGTHAHYGRLPSSRRRLRPSPRLGIPDDEVDEGAILAALVEGLGGAFLRDERALVEELRAANLRDGELLPEYQRRRMELLTKRGFDVSGFDPEQMTSADDVYCFPNLVGPIYPGS